MTSAPPHPEISALLDAALRLHQSGALSQAEQLYRRVVAADDRAADAWNLLALACYQQLRLDEAAGAAKRATALRPKIAPYWLTRGNVAMARRQARDAQSHFGRAIALQPDFAEAHFRLALCHHGENRIAEAVAAYRKALHGAPEVAEIYYQLAEALRIDNRLPEAIEAYEGAFARDPDGTFDRVPCMACLRNVRFESLSAFWHAEIRRFFARGNVDATRYAGVAARALLLLDPFRAALVAARHSPDRFRQDADALGAVMRDTLLQSLLRDALIVTPELELLLTRVRAALLADAELRAQAPFEFLCGLALQCFNNEFVFAEGADEAAQADELQRAIDAGPGRAGAEPGDESALRSLVTLAMYRPLHAVSGIDALLAAPHNAAALERLLKESVRNVLSERALRAKIPSMGAITDTVSVAVRTQYEEHPFPRWSGIDRAARISAAAWLGREVPGLPPRASFPEKLRVLVAGCGTGREAIGIAGEIEGAELLAVDLSATSLAYARRMADELGVANVDFRQGDILGLEGMDELTERFDLILCNGVLHHLREPREGLRVLTRLLRPGGWLKVGLYSARARAGVNAAREQIRDRKLMPTSSAIRAFRQHVLEAGPDSALGSLPGFRDFYSTSMCRDLMFHVQEHQFHLPDMVAMLRDRGLYVLGFARDLPGPAVAAYRKMFPGDSQLTDFGNWDAFEARHPETFAGMYKLWCCKPDAGGP